MPRIAAGRAWMGRSRPNRPATLLALGVVGLIAACAPAAPSTSNAAEPRSDQARPQPHGTVRIAWKFEPDTLSPKFLAGSGAGDYTWIFNASLAIRDLTYAPHPMLAHELPTQ